MRMLPQTSACPSGWPHRNTNYGHSGDLKVAATFPQTGSTDAAARP
jgi:hypothetical protein